MCFKELKRKDNAKRHFEEVHCENIQSECHLCFKMFKNSRYLDNHITTVHKRGMTITFSANK